MTTLYLEMRDFEVDRKDEFVAEAVKDWRDGYGAGTCTAEDWASWSSDPKEHCDGWTLFTITLDDTITVEEVKND
jgi:hypothetical protein